MSVDCYLSDFAEGLLEEAYAGVMAMLQPGTMEVVFLHQAETSRGWDWCSLGWARLSEAVGRSSDMTDTDFSSQPQ